MSDNHLTTREQDARRKSHPAEPTSAAYPASPGRGLKGPWTRAVLNLASRSIARRTTDLAALLVLAMAASEAWAQPPFGPPPMPGPPPMGGPPMGGLPFGGPPMGGLPFGGPPMGAPTMGGLPFAGPPPGSMIGAPRLGPTSGMGFGGRPGPLPVGLARPPLGRPGAPAGQGFARPPGTGPIPKGAGVAAGRPIPGRPVPGGTRGRPADLARVGAAGRAELGRAYNAHHADWYRGGWANPRGGTWDRGRESAAWDKARDYVREERARDYATGLAWGLGGWGSSGYGSGSGSSSGYGTGYNSGYGAGYSSAYGTGSGDAYANASSDASSTSSDSSGTTEAQETRSDGQQDGAAAEQADQTFDRARESFKAGDYAAALDLTEAALKDIPDDPLVHEFKALVLFARGEDARAAAELHDVLAARPGMDWSTMSGLYADVETYTGQLRSLEERSRRDPKTVAPRFALAYHYLVTGHNDAAVAQLKASLALEPGDRVVRQLLASLTGPPPVPPEPARTAPNDGTAGRTPSADLAGRWRGERDGSTFDLSFDGRGRFAWRAARDGKISATISGVYALSGDTLTLKADDRPPLRASVIEASPDSLRLKTVADIPGDPGLGFRRVDTPAEPGR